VLIIAAQCMFEPESDGRQKKTADVNLAKDITSPQFLLITAGLFSGTFAGLLVIGNLVPIVRASGLSAGEAVAAVSIFAAGNAAGRITWGHIFDRFGFSSIPASLILLGSCIAALFLYIPAWSILILIGLIGFGFGGCFVIYASAVSRYFGVEAFPLLYPLNFLGYGAAGIIGPVIGGGLADITGSFDSALALSVMVLAAAGVVTTWGLKFFRAKGESEIAWSSEV
ncbi:MAG: MFS transporter, partial [Sediminispirochaetaceae bacterium]